MCHVSYMHAHEPDRDRARRVARACAIRPTRHIHTVRVYTSMPRADAPPLVSRRSPLACPPQARTRRLATRLRTPVPPRRRTHSSTTARARVSASRSAHVRTATHSTPSVSSARCASRAPGLKCQDGAAAALARDARARGARARDGGVRFWSDAVRRAQRPAKIFCLRRAEALGPHRGLYFDGAQGPTKI